MLRLSALALVLALAAPLASAQNPDSTLTPDARALLFQIGPDLDLSSLDGATVSLKWHRSPTRATRLGLTLGFGADTGGTDSEVQADDVSRQDVQLGTTLVFLSYAEGRTPIRFYRGLGPAVSVGFDRLSQRQRLDGSRRAEATESSLHLSAGLAGALGAEWVVHPAIGLTAEYSTALTLNYSRRSRSTEQFFEGGGTEPIESVTDRIGVRLHPGGARLGLSVYF